MNANADPTPTSLSAETPPPIRSARFRQIVSPSPVPPYWRVVDASAWTKLPNTASSLSGAIPTPVSSTANRSRARPGPAVPGGAAETRTTTDPSAVNLTAFESRFTSTCRTRLTSPTTEGATSSRTA